MELKKKRIAPGVIALEMAGSIYMGADCQQIQQEVEQLIRENEKRVIFDLTAVTHIDSAGVGRIVMCFSHMTKSGGTLRLAGVQGMVERVLKMTHVHKVIPIFPTALEASQNFPPAKEGHPAKG